jgi:Polyketide cyclase / dehydrase and lipid transport
MRTFRISVDIGAPPERVWQVMREVDRWHEWTKSVTSITRKDHGPFVVGSRAVIRQPKFPPALWTVTAIGPGPSFEWTNRAPGIRVVGRHSVEPIAIGARATLSLEYQGLFGGLLARMTKAITERYLELEANGLRARSENPSFHV